MQMANRKLQIAELVFSNTLFAPTFYFGLINIASLIFFQLFQYQNSFFQSKTVFADLMITETYLFLIFCVLIVILLFKVFALLNFSRLTDLYIKDLIELIRLQKNQKAERKDLQKIGLKRIEVLQEIHEGVSKKDELLVEKLLDCIETAMNIDNNSPFLFALSVSLKEWLIMSDNSALVKGKLLAFWRNYTFLQANVISANQFVLRFFPANVYKTSKAEGLTDNYSDAFSIRLKEMILYQILYQWKNNSDELKRRFGQFQNLLDCFSELILEAALHNDKKAVTYSLNQLMSIIKSASLFASSKANQDETVVIGDIRKDNLNNSKNDIQLRVTAIPMTIYFYLFFRLLYNSDKLVNREILFSLRDEAFRYNSRTSLILTLFNTGFRSEQWEDWLWRVEDRLDGVVYHIPSLEDLLAFGFVVDLLVSPSMENIIEETDYDNPNLQFLISQARTALQGLRREFWSDQLAITESEFDLKVTEIEARLKEVESKNRIAELKSIASEKLDEERVRNFVRLVINEWEEFNNIDYLFQLLGMVEIDPAKTLVNLHPHIFARGLKRLFLSSSRVILDGLDLGKRMAIDKEKLLGLRLSEAKLKTARAANIVDGLDEGIRQLTSRKMKASVVFLFANWLYSQEGVLNNSGRYSPRTNENANQFKFDFLGIYESKLPIVRVHSSDLKNTVVVCDLKSGVKLQQREHDEWIEKRVQISIKQVFDEQVDEIFRRKEYLFGDTLTDDIRLEILNAVLIEIDEICDFEVFNPDAFYAFELTPGALK